MTMNNAVRTICEVAKWLDGKKGFFAPTERSFAEGMRRVGLDPGDRKAVTGLNHGLYVRNEYLEDLYRFLEDLG